MTKEFSKILLRQQNKKGLEEIFQLRICAMGQTFCGYNAAKASEMRGKMKEESWKRVKDLEAASREGVLIYKEGRLASPEEIAHTPWVREEMAYVPDFIVLDEEGELKEIWYEDDNSKKIVGMSPINHEE